MAEDSRFFTSSTGDVRSYSSANFAEVLNKVLTTGYFAGSGGELAVTASSPADMNINVATGEAWIQGYYYKNTASKVLAVTAADGSNPRIDRVVLELDLVTNRLITLKMLDGTPAASPVAPALTQSGTTYQITLAQVYVAAGATSLAAGTITDERDTVTAPVSGANQAKANSLYSGSIYHLTGSDLKLTTARTSGVMLCQDGTYVWAIGGSASNKKVEYFTMAADSSNGTWTAGTGMTTGRHYGTATYYNGNIYVMGGLEGATYSVKNEIYSISGNSWSAGTNVTTARAYHAAVLVGDDIYIIGGATTGGGGSTANQKYDVSGNSWTTLAVLPTTPANASAGVTSACTDGTDIYINYTEVTSGTIRFYKYTVDSDGYTALTAPSAALDVMWYDDGYIFGIANGTKTLRRYSIALGTWNNSYNTDTDMQQQVSDIGNYFSCIFFKNRIFGVQTGTACKWFTYRYPLVASMTARSLCGFRTNNDTTYYALRNQDTDLNSLVNGVIGCAVGDELDLYVNNKSATATATITVYG